MVTETYKNATFRRSCAHKTQKTEQKACTHQHSLCIFKKLIYFQISSKMKVISNLKYHRKTMELIDVAHRFGISLPNNTFYYLQTTLL